MMSVHREISNPNNGFRWVICDYVDKDQRVNSIEVPMPGFTLRINCHPNKYPELYKAVQDNDFHKAMNVALDISQSWWKQHQTEVEAWIREIESDS